MLHQIAHYGLLAGLAIALLIAIATDLKSRRIYNWLTLTVALAAPLYWWNSGLAPWPGVAIQLAAGAGVFAVCYLFFALGQMGGGDVKLLGALALWIPFDRLPALVVMMAIIGWLLTMGMAAWRVGKSSGSGASRDMIVLTVCFIIAFAIGAVLLGGFAMPQMLRGWSAGNLAGALVVALAPSLILLVATLVSLRVIKRHAARIQVPYGLAIAIAGLWIIGDLALGTPAAPLAA
ncbi:MAG: prepilin peptidase [Erythrobacter sp.]|nr:prepilin peptidase [Erythrobacter sp.]